MDNAELRNGCEACPSCLDYFLADDIISLGCSHGFCHACLQRFLGAAAPLPRCPVASCRRRVALEVVGAILGDAGRAICEAALLEQALEELRGRVACPNPSCAGVVVCEGKERMRIACPCGYAPFCSRCRQPYHYHHDCGAVQSLREQWLGWLSDGLGKYLGEEAGFREFVEERGLAMETASLRHRELLQDEQYKADVCRLCPHCYRPVEKLDGCNSMRCGDNYHGGAQQPGCGKLFDWSRAPRYQAAVQERRLPVQDTAPALLRGAGCRHLFTRCALCHDMVCGPRFRCIHCESFDLCLRCVAAPMASSHPKDHVFEVIFAPVEPSIEDLPRGTRVSVFGLEGAGAGLNGSAAQVWRYSQAEGLYELSLPNGSRPVVRKEHVQPDVQDPADAQAVLELALGQQELRQGFHLGIPVGCLVRVIESANGSADDAFYPVAIIQFYDPASAEYGLRWEEPSQWACQRCTLLNDARVRRCTACGAAAILGGIFRVPVDCVEPMVRSTDEVKQIVQRHWKETQRLEHVHTIQNAGPFSGYDLDPTLIKGISSFGLDKESAFQKKAIQAILGGRDVFANGKKGAGQTVAYVIGLLGRINRHRKSCQGLVLVPSREVSQQVDSVIRALSQHMKISSCCFHNSSHHPDSDACGTSNEHHIVIGSPGTPFYKMISSGQFGLDELIVLIVDGVDDVMAGGFGDALRRVVSSLPPTVQKCFFSVTLQGGRNLAAECLREEVCLSVEAEEELSLRQVQHFYLDVEKEEWKFETLCDVYESFEVAQSLVFCHGDGRAESVAVQLQSHGLLASLMSRKMAAGAQQEVFQDLRSGATEVVVCDGVPFWEHGAMEHVQFVVNYDLPETVEAYLHCVGCRGTKNKRVALTFSSISDVRRLREIGEHFGITLEDCPMDIAELLDATPPWEIERQRLVAADPRAA